MKIKVIQNNAGGGKFSVDILDGLINIKRIEPLKITQITAGTSPEISSML